MSACILNYIIMNLVLAYIAIPLIIILSDTPLSSVAEAATTSLATITPIKHLVIIFQENIPFDHYFVTCLHSADPPGQPNFTLYANTSTDMNNLLTSRRLFDNPNLVKPFGLDRSRCNK